VNAVGVARNLVTPLLVALAVAAAWLTASRPAANGAGAAVLLAVLALLAWWETRVLHRAFVRLSRLPRLAEAGPEDLLRCVPLTPVGVVMHAVGGQLACFAIVFGAFVVIHGEGAGSAIALACAVATGGALRTALGAAVLALALDGLPSDRVRRVIADALGG
jgi:hypothetical protein